MSMGVYAKKIGMSRLFDEDGNHIPVTLLKADVAKVIEHRTKEKNGYTAVVVGFDEVKDKKLNAPQVGYLKKNNSAFYRSIKEFRVDESDLPPVGSDLKIDIFKKDSWVDVQSVSKGKGFAGVMKRHNFGGLRASHGVSISHRSHGSTGNARTEGKVYKGKKMAGQLGNKKVSIQNLKICSVDLENNLLIVRGALPGAKGSIVRVLPAIKKVV